MLATFNSGCGSISDVFIKGARLLVAVALFCLGAAGQESTRLNNSGAQALASGDLKTALDQFQRAAKLEPDNLQLQFNIGLTLIRLGLPGQAVAALERAVRDPAIADEARYLLGNSHFQLADYAKAIDAVKDLTDGPRAEHVLYMIEESNRLLGHGAEARDAFRRLNRRYPDSPWTHYLLGVAFESQSELDKAIIEYKTALERDAKLPNAAFAIGYLYWRQKDPEAAKSWFETQLSTHPCHALAMFYLGQIAGADRGPTAAAKLYSQSISCDADSSEAHLRLGVTLAEMGQDKEALRELTRAIELAPDDFRAHYRLALLYKKLGRQEESKAEYEVVRRIQAKEN